MPKSSYINKPRKKNGLKRLIGFYSNFTVIFHSFSRKINNIEMLNFSLSRREESWKKRIHTEMSFGKCPGQNVPDFWSLEKMSFRFRPLKNVLRINVLDENVF